MAAAARSEPVATGLEPGLPLGFQGVTDPGLMAAVHDHWDGDFILPLLRSRVGLDLVCCDRRWPRGRAGVVSVPVGTDIAGCSVPLTGPGLAGRRVEVAGLPDPGAAFGLNLVVPGNVQPAARAVAGGELFRRRSSSR